MSAEILTISLKISIVIYMAGILLDMGLRLNLRDAFTGIKNFRFVTYSLLWGFVIIPAVAWLTTIIFPLEQPYVIGMILLGVTPCAPFLPMMVDKAKGNFGLTAAFMLLVSAFIVLYMPFAVPFLVKGLSVSVWAIARPLLILVLMPMVIGILTRRFTPKLASKIQPVVKNISLVFTIIMLLLILIIYGKSLISSAGSFFLAAQLTFFIIVSIAPYVFSFGLKREEKVVLTLGLTTRNLGAALAPLYAIASIDERAVVMVVLGVPLQLIFAALAARWFKRHAPVE
jgi:BASS family bile acid:Na+ symporter